MPPHTPPESFPPDSREKKVESTSAEAPTAAEIAAEAYAIFLHRGAQHGQSVEHWLEAEQLLRAKRVAAHAAGSSQTVSPPEESTRGQEGDDRQRAVGAGSASRAPQEEPVSGSEEPRQSASAARGTSISKPSGQHAGSGQVQRRDDPQAPGTGSQEGIGQEAERQKGRIQEQRGDKERN